MNQEKLKFIPGDTIQVMPSDGAGSGGFESQIHVVGEEVWLCRINVYGYRQDDAEALRDRILWALEQPTVPAQWQYQSKEDPRWWENLKHGGEAAQMKGRGFEVRALYIKTPLPEVLKNES